jgi:hypothetical protein
MRKQSAQRVAVARIRRRDNGEVGRAGCSGRRGEARETRENRRHSVDLRLQARSCRSKLRQRNRAHRFHTWIWHPYGNRAMSSDQCANSQERLAPLTPRNADARRGSNARESFPHKRFPQCRSGRDAKGNQASSRLQHPSRAWRQREQESSAGEESRFSCQMLYHKSVVKNRVGRCEGFPLQRTALLSFFQPSSCAR